MNSPTDMVGPDAAIAFAVVALIGFVLFLLTLKQQDAKGERWLFLGVAAMGILLCWTALVPLPH